MTLLTATSAHASAHRAAVAVGAAGDRTGQTRARFGFACAHTAIGVKTMDTSSISISAACGAANDGNGNGFVSKRGERDSWTTMGSCGSAEVLG